MRQRFVEAEEAETLNRIAAEEAIRFYFGSQWQAAIEQQRKEDGRPCFTLNKLPAIIRQILNEERVNRPAAQINPVGEGADEDTAEAIQGLVRHVDVNGEGADVAIGTAFTYLVLGGFGSWRILTDYLPKSFDQDLFLERIRNPFSVYWDAASQKLDKSDARFCFITTDFGTDAYKVAFPKSEICGAADFSGFGDRAPGWVSRNGCRVVEYFEIDEEQATLVKLEDGSTAYEDELPEGARIAKDEDGKPITRPDIRRRAYVSKSNGLEWLEHRKALPTDDIPVVTITADELVVDGEVRLKGAVQDLMEPQRLFNYNSSAIAETMALGTKAQWLATNEQIEPYQAIWRAANSRNIAVLPYKNMPGQAPPAKIATEPPIQAMSEARAQSNDDLRSISGVYDATQSPNGGEESGRAVLARRRQAAAGNSHYKANLARGIRRSTQILMKYFRVVYDTARVMRIAGMDGQEKTVMVHSGRPDSLPAAPPPNIKGVFDLQAGNYDVTVTVQDVGDETKRQEAVETLITLAETAPQIVPIIGDLIVEQMDFSGKRAIVERMRKALPPQLQDGNPTDPNQLAAHNTQLMQQNHTLMQQVQHLTQLVQTKQIENQGRVQVEGMKLQAAQVRADSAETVERVKAGSALITHAADKQFDAVHDHAVAHREHAQSLHAASHAAAIQRINAEHAAALSRANAEHAQAIAPAEQLPQAA